MKKALIAMSGGVDSSVCAYLMTKEYDCKGVTMNLFEKPCGSSDFEDARQICIKLGIPFYVADFQDEFKKYVIDKFISSYETGETPNPCIECNRYMKFQKLFEYGEKSGCEILATGHYARIEKSGNSYFLKKATDLSKDQSYVLYSVPRELLSKIVFPLGALTKSEVREIAESQGFTNAGKKDSQDICFVPDGDYASVIKSYTGKDYPEGDFVDISGKVWGRHKGIIKYTTGQRKGLGLALPYPMYVCRKDMENNRVILGKNEDLFSKSAEAKDFNFLCDNAPEKFRVFAKVRYNQTEQPATVFITGENSVRIEFDQPQRAITPGQSAVLYDGDTVIGGGVII